VGVVSERDPHAAPDITVYGPAQAPFVVKVGLALRMKKLAFEVVEPAGPEDFQRWNPETGLLPVIDVDGTRVADSSKILDWIDAHFPEPPLLARDPRIARAQRGLEQWTGETFYYYWLRWLRELFDLPEIAEQPKTGTSPMVGELARLGILSRMRQAIAERATGMELGNLDNEFERRLDDLIGFLGARPFFHADRPSRADLTVVAFLRSLETGHIPGGHRMLAARPPLVALMARLDAEISAL
jgi:glutathione S-transferase